MRVDMSVYPLISVIQRENLGEPHPVLAGGERYVSARFGDAADRWLAAELAESGVAGRGPLADFTGMLSIIQAAHTEFYGWTTGDDDRAVLVAAQGHNAFAVIRRGDRVTVRRVRANRLAEALVDRLPEVAPARGESLSAPETELVRPGPKPLLRGPRRD